MNKKPNFNNIKCSLPEMVILTAPRHSAFTLMTLSAKGVYMTLNISDTQHKNTTIILSAIMLSFTFYLFLYRVSLCWMPLCWMSLCWGSLCWVLLCWISLCWGSLCWSSFRHFNDKKLKTIYWASFRLDQAGFCPMLYNLR